jgi:hypothetical protein
MKTRGDSENGSIYFAILVLMHSEHDDIKFVLIKHSVTVVVRFVDELMNVPISHIMA